MKILITGGHFTPALALIDELKSDYQIVFVGRKAEEKEIRQRQIPFYNLKTGRFTRIFNFKSLTNFILIFNGLIQSWIIITKERPDLIVSFGGYLAFPICLVGKIKKIPFFIHEQTSKPGLVNKITSRYAEKIFLAFPEAANYFPKDKTILSGNPLRLDIFKIKEKPFTFVKDRPVIYITGGSLGAHSINLIIEKLLPKLLEKYIVIHQTGSAQEFNDYGKLLALKRKLPENQRNYYYPARHFSGAQIGYIYSLTDLVVGRSGANTFFELIALKIPAIFIPLPWSANKEQQQQANLLKEAGAGDIFDQSEEPTRLLELINKVTADLETYRKNLDKLQKLYAPDAIQIIKKNIIQTLE